MLSLTEDVDRHLRGGGTLVVPSWQRARSVQLARASGELAAGRRVWPSDDVIGAAAWVRREAERWALAQAASSPRLLSAAQEWHLWRSCVLEATRDLALLDRAALADSLQRSRELAADYRISPQPAAAGTEAALLLETEQAFAARCRAFGALDASSLFEALTAADARPVRVLARGFDALPPRLRARADADPMPTRSPAESTLLLASDTTQECEHIAAWCAERVRQQGDARLLVIMPGMADVRERLAALIRQALDPGSALTASGSSSSWVSIEGGVPLAQQPLIAHALATLAWLAGTEADFEAASAWLRAPHWVRPEAALRARLALMLRERGLPRLDLRALIGGLRLVPRSLEPAARELAAQLTRASAALGEGSASVRVWSERFSKALRAAGWPGAPSPESPLQQSLLRWHELLEEFGELAASSGDLARQPAVRLLEELAARRASPPAEEDASVTIFPVLTDPVVRYDGIWVAGLHAEAFPQPVQPDPFLPLPAQLAAGVPAASAAGRLAQARALLAAWGAGSRELVLSAPTHLGDFELLPSPLLTGAAVRRSPRSVWLPAQLHREGLTESLVDSVGLPWPAAKNLPRGTRSLDLQNQCPFRAYAELRLGSVRPQALEPGIGAQQRGELLHAALQHLWGRLGGSEALQQLSEASLDELIGASVARAREQVLAASATHGARRAGDTQLDMFVPAAPAAAREGRRAARLIRRLCELERRRAPFRVAGTEISTGLMLGGGTVQLRIDRVDTLADGGRAVLDYKSGRRVPGDWQGERPAHPQLLAYASALGDDVLALATVCVNARQVRFDGIASAVGLLPEVRALRAAGEGSASAWSRQQLAWRRLIERLIAAFLAGDAAVDPKPGACTYCHVVDICRIGEVAAGDTPVASESVDE